MTRYIIDTLRRGFKKHRLLEKAFHVSLSSSLIV